MNTATAISCELASQLNIDKLQRVKLIITVYAEIHSGFTVNSLGGYSVTSQFEVTQLRRKSFRVIVSPKLISMLAKHNRKLA